MALSDAQIDRFSRQIILPQIGGVGQERLLQSSVAIGGDGELAEIVALYLTGAGIGRIALYGADPTGLCAALIDLDPDVQVTLHTGALGREVDADLLVACDLGLGELDVAAASRQPLVAGGVEGDHGWMVVAQSPHICASCAARDPAGDAIGEHPVVDPPHPVPLPAGEGTLQAARVPQGPLSRRERDRVRGFDTRTPPPSALTSTATGVVGSLMALAALKLRLGLGEPARRVWLEFDPQRSTLVEHVLVRAADCPVCAAA